MIPISISKNWNLILRTIVPIVSQHDLFFVPNLPKNSPLQPQNRSQDGLSDTLQSFFFSPEETGSLRIDLGSRTGTFFIPPEPIPYWVPTGLSIGPTVVVLE